MYTNYFYNTYIIGAFHNFPEPVAKELRKALYFTNQDLKPHQAIKFYKKTLRVAEDVGMDPFSNEILGVKFQLAAFMEKIQKYHKAIQVLEIVRNDCLEWIEEYGDKPENAAKRTRVLGKTIGISVKLGELYAGEYVKEPEMAEEKLVWAVEATLKELQRREKEGVKPHEGEWLTHEQIGGSFEGMFDQQTKTRTSTDALQPLAITMRSETSIISPHHFSYRQSTCLRQSRATRLS